MCTGSTADPFSGPRTTQSERAESDFYNWSALPPSQRPLAVARDEVAKHLDAILHAHWSRHEFAFSDAALAEDCGINKKIPGEWRSNAKTMPVAALLVLPATLVSEILSWVAERRALGHEQRAVTALDAAIDRLEKPIRTEDYAEVHRSLVAARKRIEARLDRLALEGK